jgi:hypothetical protein
MIHDILGNGSDPDGSNVPSKHDTSCETDPAPPPARNDCAAPTAIPQRIRAQPIDWGSAASWRSEALGGRAPSV